MNVQVDFSATLTVPITIWVKTDDHGGYEVTSVIVSTSPLPGEVTESLSTDELEQLDLAVGAAIREASR